MEDIYMSGEGLYRTGDNAGKCRTVRPDAWPHPTHRILNWVNVTNFQQSTKILLQQINEKQFGALNTYCSYFYILMKKVVLSASTGLNSLFLSVGTAQTAQIVQFFFKFVQFLF